MCFEIIKEETFHSLVHADLCICQKCQDQFVAIFENKTISDVNVCALYDYNEFMQSNLFKLKGCGDIELAPCFLNYHLPWLMARYRRHIIVPAPSYADRDAKRGFNQVEEIFRSSKLPLIKAIIKTEDRKQSDLSQDERNKIKEIIAWKEQADISGKKVLLVDDVMTTGSTIRACIDLIKHHHPKSLDVLVISRVANNGQR